MIFTMLLLSLSPLLYELPVSTAVICAPLLLFAWRKIPVPFWLQQFLAIFIGVGLYLWHGTLQTPEAASSLIAAAVCLKTLSVKTTRDQMWLLMMNLVLVMCYVLFAQTLTSTILLVANYVVFILRLLDLQKQKLQLHIAAFNFKQLASPETLIALPLLIGLFLFFPRFTTPWGGFGGATTQQIIGYSQNLNPGQMQNLAESETVAFRISFENNRQPDAETLYFRGGVLTQNNEWSWQEPAPSLRPPKFNQTSLESDYQILLEPRFEKTLFTLESTKQIFIQPNSEFSQSSNDTFQLRWPAQGKIKLDGLVEKSAASRFERDASDFLQTNTTVSPRMQQLVDSLKNKSESEKLQGLLDFFRQNSFKYSTQTPNYRSLDGFLFGERVGFCEHFAASFAVLARLSGLPATVIVGFQGAEYNTFGSFFVVKDKHAHAWNEVYLSSTGWQRVDITALIAPARIRQGALYNKQSDSLLFSQSLGLLERAVMAWDAVNNRFSLLLMNYNLENQVALLEQFSLSKIGLNSVLRVMMVIVVIFAIVFWLVSWGGKTKQDAIAKGYILLNQKLQKIGVSRAPHEGPNDLRKKLAALSQVSPKVLALLDNYIVLRFGSNASAQEAKRFYKDVKQLKVYK